MVAYRSKDDPKDVTRPFILIPRDLWRQFCLKSVRLDRTPRFVLVDLIRDWLTEEPKKTMSTATLRRTKSE